MTDPAKEKARLIVAAARERQAFDLVLMKVDQLSSITDYFLICSCRSSRQVQALADHILTQAKARGGARPLGVEGMAQGHWVLLDFGEVVVHIFYQPVREFYDLESLWSEAERIEIEHETPAKKALLGRKAEIEVRS